MEDIWASLPEPTGVPEAGLPNPDDLNYFVADARFLQRRVRVVQMVQAAIGSVLAGSRVDSKIIAARYGSSLPEVSRESLKVLNERLEPYVRSVALALDASREV